MKFPPVFSSIRARFLRVLPWIPKLAFMALVFVVLFTPPLDFDWNFSELDWRIILWIFVIAYLGEMQFKIGEIKESLIRIEILLSGGGKEKGAV